MKRFLLVVVAVPCLALPSLVRAAVPTAEEMALARQWVSASLGDRAAEPFFSFTYDGKPSADLLSQWKATQTSRQLDDQRTERTLTWTDPKSALEVRCVAIEYRDFPAVDWVLYVTNTGKQNSPILENLCALDTPFSRAAPGEFTVHHIRGSDARTNDFEPLAEKVPATGELTVFSRGQSSAMDSSTGNPSDEAMPMFNIECDRQGIIAALGWSGPWTATFQRDGDRTVRVRAKMDSTHLYLKPGERIRSPRILLLFWKGDRIDSQNLWRRLILAHYSPRPGGTPFTGLICDANWSNVMDADHHIQQLQWWGDHDIPMECYWMDAAWTDMSKGWFAHQSHQTPNKKLFPNGMRPISDAAHRRDMKYLLWFVPHSLNPEVGIGKDHPEYLGSPCIVKGYPGQKFYLLDHGNPEINRFAIEYFSKIIADFGVDVFRQDGTAGWYRDTGPDRLGISQIRYMEGFYEFWDGLLRNNPNLLIDNCATGARRIELETMKRSIGLHRSDLGLQPHYATVVQAYNQGMMPWVPLHGGVVILSQLSAYSVRSAYCPALLLAWPDEGMPPTAWYTDMAKRWSIIDMNLLRRLVKEYVRVRPYVFGDYYPLTPYSLDAKVWAGWQFDRPDLGEGMVQVFRRPDSPDESKHVKLRGLEPDAVYTLTNLDSGNVTESTGRDLAEKGITILIKDKPGSAIIVYKKKPTAAASNAVAAQDVRMKWWRDARFGMFIHWGIYSQLGRGEWVQFNEKIPVKEYEKLAATFNPAKFDADAWVKLAKDAGCKYIVITAKHHDGFSMFRTKLSPFNIIDATPLKRDPMAELAKACQQQGLRLCFYYSHVREWRHPLAQSFESGNNYGNSWDYKDESKKDLSRFVDEFAKPQLRELLTQYGPIGLIWFDTPSFLKDEKAKECISLVRSLQPECLVNSRVGGSGWDYVSMGDCEVPPEGLGKDWEAPMTNCGSWGYSSDPNNRYHTPQELIHLLVNCASMGGNLLLNVGPTGEGVIPPQATGPLEAVGKWMKQNGESIYGTQASPFKKPFVWGRCTQRPGKLYLHVYNWPKTKLLVPGLKNKVEKAYLLSDPEQKPLAILQMEDNVAVELPAEAPDKLDSVVVLFIL
jgi:alpha-L-fucosidase